jgi:archaellum biogenesis ATPase FlaH
MGTATSRLSDKSAPESDAGPIGPDDDLPEACPNRSATQEPLRVAPSPSSVLISGNSNGDLKETPEDPWKGSPAWELERLWAEGSKPRQWIVEPLIAAGDQILLAGEPKSGKSLLASQLCLEIMPTKDKKKPGWTVLYVSFEMDKTVMWARASQQAEGLKITLLDPQLNKLGELAPADYMPGAHKSALDYYHLFDLEGRRTFGIAPKYRELSDVHREENEATRLAWFELMDKIKPDLIIFDSLSQLHFCDENANLEMRDALQQLRDLCTVKESRPNGHGSRYKRRVAHIIIHHTRKEAGDKKYFRKDASEMRGASSIHSEADLAITITKRNSNGEAISLSFSSRHSSNLTDVRLDRRRDSGTYHPSPPVEPGKLTTARNLFEILSGRNLLSVKEIMALYRKRYRKQAAAAGAKSNWEKLLNDLAKDGLIKKQRGVKGTPMKFGSRKDMNQKKWRVGTAMVFGKDAGVDQKVGKSP